jgi:hypothetical protein
MSFRNCDFNNQNINYTQIEVKHYKTPESVSCYVAQWLLLYVPLSVTY